MPDKKYLGNPYAERAEPFLGEREKDSPLSNLKDQMYPFFSI